METALQKHSLYQIRIDHLSLLQEIEDNEGELTPEVSQALSLTEEQFQEKAISYGYILKTLDNTTSIIDAEIKRLMKLKERSERNKETFKERLSEAMQQFGVEKINTPTLTLSFRKSESIEISDEDKVPDNFFDQKTIFTISKTRIKEAIKEGKQVPGAELISKQNLQVK